MTSPPREPTQEMWEAGKAALKFGPRAVWMDMYEAWREEARKAALEPPAPPLEPATPQQLPTPPTWEPGQPATRKRRDPHPIAKAQSAESLIARLEHMADEFGRARDSDGNPDECAHRDIGYHGGPLFAEAAAMLHSQQEEIAFLEESVWIETEVCIELRARAEKAEAAAVAPDARDAEIAFRDGQLERCGETARHYQERARIAETALAALKTAFRVNTLRLRPETSHAEISAAIDRAIAEQGSAK